MSRADLGVVVPTLNSERTLDWTLLSLRSQRGCRLQVIVVDSGSTDATLGICERWGIDHLYAPPGSMYRAVNAGIKALDTDWVTYLNSDDVMYADAYTRLLSRGRETDADVVYGQSDFVDPSGRYLYSLGAVSPRLLPALTRAGEMGLAQPATVFRHALYDELQGFDESYRFVADLQLFGRAVESGRRFVRLDPPSVSAFRLHPDQLSALPGRPDLEEHRRLMEEMGWRRTLVGQMARAGWRAANWRHYLARLLHTGTLRGR